MKKTQEPVRRDPEFVAMESVYAALSALEPDAQRRVIDYVVGKLGISSLRLAQSNADLDGANERGVSLDVPTTAMSAPQPSSSDDGDAGINVIAQKWMKRNALTSEQLTSLFSLGGEEIDLIAKRVPGDSKKQRMRSVLLLKGVAAYLGSGAARVTHEQLKETCLHYDAFDAANFAAHIKSFGKEVAGSKSAGYTLTQSGLAAATEIVKQAPAVKA